MEKSKPKKEEKESVKKEEIQKEEVKTEETSSKTDEKKKSKPFKIKVVEKKENKLLGREEVFFEINFKESSTPRREDVRSKLIATINSKPGLTIILPLKTSFGRTIALGAAHVYKDEKQMRRVCLHYLLVRSGLAEKKAKKKKKGVKK